MCCVGMACGFSKRVRVESVRKKSKEWDCSPTVLCSTLVYQAVESSVDYFWLWCGSPLWSWAYSSKSFACVIDCFPGLNMKAKKSDPSQEKTAKDEPRHWLRVQPTVLRATLYFLLFPSFLSFFLWVNAHLFCSPMPEQKRTTRQEKRKRQGKTNDEKAAQSRTDRQCWARNEPGMSEK